ncbi:MAG: hypothetical protein ACI8UR_001652 [Natronomonas sp.]|jgi:hypothetical protein|uniref:hypothetical protein n=1 Tax=Natronomonas sp. TaxID=2184060 RepID=UPI003989B8A3
MRRIYESRALEYDDDDPYAPKRSDGDGRDRKAIDLGAASHALMPTRLRRLALGISIETDADTYATGESVNFKINFENRIPFPIALQTSSPVRWAWSIDGLDEASHVTNYPNSGSLFEFGRSERKTFRRRWRQRFRESERSWAPADPGEYTLSVRVNTPDAATKGLTDETTFTIE